MLGSSMPELEMIGQRIIKLKHGQTIVKNWEEGTVEIQGQDLKTVILPPMMKHSKSSAGKSSKDHRVCGDWVRTE